MLLRDEFGLCTGTFSSVRKYADIPTSADASAPAPALPVKAPGGVRFTFFTWPALNGSETLEGEGDLAPNPASAPNPAPAPLVELEN